MFYLSARNTETEGTTMSTPTYAWTPEFTITQDRAGHLTAERIDAKGMPLGAIDFGQTHPVCSVLLTWLEMEVREELAPAIDALLREEFAKRQH